MTGPQTSFHLKLIQVESHERPALTKTNKLNLFFYKFFFIHISIIKAPQFCHLFTSSGGPRQKVRRGA